MENTDTKTKRNVIRSPGYPMLSLKEAIEKAQILWDKDRNNTIPIEAAFKHLGYASTGGYAARIMAALKKYDLIFENKSGIKLTEAAEDLFLSGPESSRYMDTIKKLALKPAIYEKIIADCDGMVPSDETLKYKLIKEHNFNAKSVDDFITTFRATMEFASLIGDNTMQRTASLKPSTYEHNLSEPNLQQPQEPQKSLAMPGTVFPIPLSKRKQAAIAFETLPVEKRDIEAIKKWLELFENSLTETEET